MKKLIIAGSVTTMTLLAFFIFYPTQKKTPPVENKRIQQEDVLIHGLSLNDKIKQKNKASFNIHLQAKHCSLSKKSDIITCNHLCGTITNKKKTIGLLRAKHALFDKAKKIITFPEQLQADVSGMTIHAQHGHYNLNCNTLTLEKNISCTHPNMKTNALSAKITMKDKTCFLSGNVITEFSDCPARNKSSN